jgi:sugar phosphate isomerase/epimerase
MKVGLYASMMNLEAPAVLESAESWILHAHALRCDTVDFLAFRGFARPEDPDYLRGLRLMCTQRGLSVGYLASTGHLAGGTAAEAAEKVEAARGHIDAAVLLGAPMVRIFTGPPTSDRARQAQEVGCLQQICDAAAAAGLAIGLQNHPSTADDMLRILAQTARTNLGVLLDTGQWVGAPGDWAWREEHSGLGMDDPRRVADPAVDLGLGRIVALCCRSSTPHRNREHFIRCLYS